jgi:hypothetical protein
MSEAPDNFLASHLPIVGLVAYAIQSSDRIVSVECLSKSLYPSAAEQMLNSLVQTGRTLLPPGDSAATYCWVFECLRVYVAARTDGYCMALMVENNPGVQLHQVQTALEAFLAPPDI